jgi:hypothetical protein
MSELVAESVGELVGVVFYAIVASVLTVLGAIAELASLQELTAGQTVLGAWEVGVGILLLYAGLNVATDFVLPGLREVRSRP